MNRKLINGWWFDFEQMVAHDYRTANPLEPKTRGLYERGNGTIGKQYKHELVKFFDPPEQRFNDIIDQAYLDYLFERDCITGF